MTTPRAIDNYGGVFFDRVPVQVPNQEQSATYANRANEDLAQMSRTTDKVIIQFPTRTTNGACTPIAGRSHMGTGGGSLPTIARTSAGHYTITYPASFVDALGVAENITFSFSSGRVSDTSTIGFAQTTVSANVISVAVFDGTGTPDDLGGNITIEVDAR